MAKQLQFGCKKCGSLVAVEVQPWMDRVELKVKDGKVGESFGRLEIQCKKCGKAIAFLNLTPA